MISVIAALDEGGVIGHGGGMPWCVPEDLRRFRELTMGATVVMGRRTFQSLPAPLDGRRVIVLTHSVFRDETVASVGMPGGTATKSSSGKLSLDDVETACSLEEALSRASGEVFIAGGGEVYREALPLADRLYITRIEGLHEGDTHFPKIGPEWRIVSREPHKGFEFLEYLPIFVP